MSEYYKARRIRNLYTPSNEKHYRLSRSKLELFLNCSRCFYLDRRIGIAQPPSYPFNLNSAVDTLLKKEFDYYREKGEPHPLMVSNGIDAIPFQHPSLNDWRDALHKGIQVEIPNTNLILTGGIDDVWIDTKNEELIVVDYKATSKNSQVTIDADWQLGYKRQIEIYQWLLRQNGFKVSDMSYFVYCNGLTNVEQFNKQLQFDISVLPYVGNSDWVEKAVFLAYECLCSDEIPLHSDECDYCLYTSGLDNYLNERKLQIQTITSE